jgi:hypothetical protein
MDFFPFLENLTNSHENSGKAVFKAFPRLLYLFIRLNPFLGERKKGMERRERTERRRRERRERTGEGAEG